MARVTVEDCVDKIPNRFRLVLYSAQRSRELLNRAPSYIAQERILKNEKKTVLALREIAEGVVDIEDLGKSLVKSYRRVSDPDEESESSLYDETGARARTETKKYVAPLDLENKTSSPAKAPAKAPA